MCLMCGLEVLFNDPFRKLSRAMLVTSFGGQIMGKKAMSFYFSWMLRTHQRASSRQQCGRRYAKLAGQGKTRYSPECAGLNFIFSTKDFAYF